MRFRFILSFLLLTAAACAQQAVVFKKVMAASSAPAISANLPNVGQTMHLVTLIFPAATGAISGLQVRMEASFDNVLFFPIGADITAAPQIGGITYQISVAYGPFPYLRIRSLTSPSSPMTVWYNGEIRAVVSVINQGADRFIL